MRTYTWFSLVKERKFVTTWLGWVLGASPNYISFIVFCQNRSPKKPDQLGRWCYGVRYVLSKSSMVKMTAESRSDTLWSITSRRGGGTKYIVQPQLEHTTTPKSGPSSELLWDTALSPGHVYGSASMESKLRWSQVQPSHARSNQA